MRDIRPGTRARWVTVAAGGLTLVLSTWTFPADAQSQAERRRPVPDAVGQRPTFQAPTPEPLPREYRVTRQRLAAIHQAVARRVGYLPGEVLVKFRDGVTPGGQSRALAALRSRPPASALRWVGDVAVLTDPSQPDSTILAQQLGEQPEVEYAEPNYVASVGPRVLPHAAAPLSTGGRIARTPSDPSYGAWQWNFPAIDLPRAWDINDGADSDVIIAVVDSGLTTSTYTYTGPLWTGDAFETVTIPFGPNPDMAASRIVAPFDFAFFAAGGPVLDLDGHGSHVAGTAGQQSNNGVGLAGIAYGARIMPVKVCLGYWDVMLINAEEGFEGFEDPGLSICTYDDVIAGIRHAADNGADVINISLGGPSPSFALRDALQYAVSRGSFVSISMGNEFEVGNDVGYPAFYASSIDGVMAVASVGRSLTRAFYSNTGSHAEIAAPGGSSRDGGVNGLVWQVTLGDLASPFEVLVPAFDTGSYAEVGFQGTSMAAPHVAGAAALLKSQIPALGPADIERLLKQTARPCSTTSCSVGLGMHGARTDEFGFGLLQPRAALFGRGIAR